MIKLCSAIFARWDEHFVSDTVPVPPVYLNLNFKTSLSGPTLTVSHRY